MRIASAVVGLVLLARIAVAQQTTAGSPASRVARAVDGNVVRAHFEFLADDALEGRKPDTRGGELAASTSPHNSNASASEPRATAAPISSGCR